MAGPQPVSIPSLTPYKTLFTAEDAGIVGPGRVVALWTKSDSVTHFAAVSIAPLD